MSPAAWNIDVLLDCYSILCGIIAHKQDIYPISETQHVARPGAEIDDEQIYTSKATEKDLASNHILPRNHILSTRSCADVSYRNTNKLLDELDVVARIVRQVAPFGKLCCRRLPARHRFVSHCNVDERI